MRDFEKDRKICEAATRRGNRFKNLSGMKFGRLLVVGLSRIKGKSAYWNCVCSCGNRKDVCSSNLLNGHTKSCGCLRKDIAKEKATRHGMSRTPTHNAWEAMRQRCTDKNRKDYQRYGGRGIKVCERWNVFENFLYDMGEKPGNKSLDRVDVNGNYCPENCRWATIFEQANNQRNSVFVEYKGERLTIAQWSRKLGIHVRTLNNRLNRLGWSVEDAFSKPIQIQRKGEKHEEKLFA